MVVLDSSVPTGIDPKVIVCMGRYGSGKTQFVDYLSLATNSVKVLLEPNPNIHAIEFDWNDIKITLVDTPDFDDTNDEETLNMIAEWMKLSIKPTGIIYFHRITEPLHVVPPSMRRLKTFCEKPGKQFVFVTTHWDLIDRARAKRVEEWLRSTLNLLWDCDVQTSRFHKHAPDPWRVIQPLLVLTSSTPYQSGLDHAQSLSTLPKVNVEVGYSRDVEDDSLKPPMVRNKGTTAKSGGLQRRPEIEVYFGEQPRREAEQKRQRLHLDTFERRTNLPSSESHMGMGINKARSRWRKPIPDSPEIGRRMATTTTTSTESQIEKGSGEPQTKHGYSNFQKTRTKFYEEKKTQTVETRDVFDHERLEAIIAERLPGMVHRVLQERMVPGIAASPPSGHPSPVYITMHNAPVFRSDHSQNTTNEGSVTSHDYSLHGTHYGANKHQHQEEYDYDRFTDNTSLRSVDPRMPPQADGMSAKHSGTSPHDTTPYCHFEPPPNSHHPQPPPLDPDKLHPYSFIPRHQSLRSAHPRLHPHPYRGRGDDLSRRPGTSASSSSSSASSSQSFWNLSLNIPSRVSTRNSSRPLTPPTPPSPTSPSTPTLMHGFADFQARIRKASPELQRYCRELKERVEKRRTLPS